MDAQRVILAVWFAAGAVAGSLYFLGVLRAVRALLGERAGAEPKRGTAVPHLGRFALLGIVLALAARSGAAALLAAAAGVLLARPWIVHRLARRLR